jgi:hypothetical protein
VTWYSRSWMFEASRAIAFIAAYVRPVELPVDETAQLPVLQSTKRQFLRLVEREPGTF